MTDLSDYIRRVHEPEIAALQKRIAAQAEVIEAARAIVPEGSRHGILAWRRLQQALKALDAADVPAAREGKG